MIELHVIGAGPAYSNLPGALGSMGSRVPVEAFAIEPLQPGLLSSNGFEVEISRVRHSGESYAFRVARAGEDAGVVYSGDCASAADLLPLIRPGDLLLSEATFGPGPVPSGMPHLDGPAVGRLAEESGASHVVLGATLASVRAAYHGAVSLARPGFRAIV